MINLDMSSYLVILCNPRPAEGQEGNFRFVLTGSDLLEVRFRLADVLPYDAEAFTNMELHGQFQLGAQVVLQANSAASKWHDVYELVHAQDMDATTLTDALANEDFLDAIDDLKVAHPSAGISIRWMLAVADGGAALELQLQALPCGLAMVQTHPLLRQDNVATIVLMRQPVNCPSFDGIRIAGPVPVLFSAEPAETMAALKNNLEAYFPACQSLFTRLLATEVLPVERALEYLAQPREGRGSRPFFRQWTAPEPGPRAKKPRQAPAKPLISEKSTAGRILDLKRILTVSLAHRACSKLKSHLK
jgi:hypothetical protein